mgnify:CR=1 FL=1
MSEAPPARDVTTAGPFPWGVLRWRVVLGYTAIALAVWLASLPLDLPAYRWFEGTDTSDAWWHRALRLMGYLPLWLAVAAGYVAWDLRYRATIGWKNVFARGALLASSATLGGLFAELLKLVLRRMRPNVADGAYVIRPYLEDTLRSNNLGLPSSHSLVAFAALMMLGRLWPRAAPLCWVLAAGCGLTRVMAEAHFVSDVVLAALIAWPTASMLWWWNAREVQRHGLVKWPRRGGGNG